MTTKQIGKTLKIKMLKSFMFIVLRLLFSSLQALAADKLICRSIADEICESGDMSERMKSLEEKVSQLQKLLQTTSPTYTTISGVPRGKTATLNGLEMLLLCFKLVSKTKRLQHYP